MKQYILTLSLALFCIFCVNDIYAQEANDSIKNELIELPFGKISKDKLVGSVDIITKDGISHSALPYLSSAIDGQAVGYARGVVRGNGRNAGPLVIIDGLANRNMSSLIIEEVESIHVLKDVTAKMLYGSRAANGVILIKTKRGYNGDKRFTVTGEYGYRKANYFQEYLGAADYMNYNNQAYRNDGREPIHTQEEIDNSGTSYKYPDVDYYDMFAKDHTSFQNVNAQLAGGDDKTQYFFNMGLLSQGGLEKVGDETRTNGINVRSNLDYEVSDVVSLSLDLGGRFYSQKSNPNGNMFSDLSSYKPNDYPMFISDTPHVDSLGTSDRVGGANLYGDMVYSGYRRSEVSFAQTNMAANFDLSSVTEGLSARAYLSFDINNAITMGKDYTYRTLKPGFTEDGLRDTLIVNGVNELQGNERRVGDTYWRNVGGGAHVNYEKTFGDHSINAVGSYFLETFKVKTFANDQNTIQENKAMNYGLRANYAYKNKYIAEVSSSYMGSTRFSKDNRWKLYNSFGVSYILSEESFMDNVGFIDFLKLKASMGTMGYDQSFEHVLYNTYYYTGRSYPTGAANSQNLQGTVYRQNGNTNLSFEESKELNFGLSMRMLKNRLELNAEYFKEERSGIPTNLRFAVPGLAGVPSYVDNYNAIDTKGYEVTLQYTNRVGDFHYSLGGTLTGYESTWAQYDELNQFSFQNRKGTNVDAIWGYQSNGFYMDQDDIANYGLQDGVPLTSELGNVIPGDLKYKDLSDNYDEYNLGDNVINEYDRAILGNSRPRYIYTFNINLKYKNFSLYALGQGRGGYDVMRNGSYFTNYGNTKYTKFAADAAVPVFEDGVAVGLEDNNFSSPRLSTQSYHSFNSSTFWQKNRYYFNVRTVELKYDLPETVAQAIYAKKLGVFVQADNVLTISNEDDIDPVSGNASISSNPRYLTITGGVKLVF